MNACALLMSAVLGVGAIAQAEPRVTGHGMEGVNVLPTTLRVVIRLQAAADTLDEAIANVQGQTAELTKKLSELKPAEGTLVVEGPYMGAPGGRREMARRMAMIRRSAFAEEEATPKFTLTTSIKAEWALSSKDLVSLLREAQAIQQGVDKAAPQPAAAAKQDMNEEDMEAMLMAEAYGEEEGEPGKPIFVYVAGLAEDVLAAARRRAYQEAKDQARATAEAAGAAMGRLERLESVASPTSDENSEWMYAMMLAGQRSALQGENEATSPVLRPLSFTVGVTAEFALVAGAAPGQ
jgi:hypothetical protein